MTILLPYPNAETAFKQTKEYDGEETIIDVLTSENSFNLDQKEIRIKTISEVLDYNDQEIMTVKDSTILDEYLTLYKTEPRYNLDTDKMKVVKFSSDLLRSLQLILNYKILGGLTRKNHEFDITLSFDLDLKEKFKHLVTKQDGYLNEGDNYIDVDKRLLTENTKVTILNNSRVILFWRGVKLNEYTIRRILTLGLSYLIGALTRAELYYYIRQVIPKGTYQVTVRHRENAFVLIGVEEPIFKF